MCPWVNTNEKLSEMSYIASGKDTKKYHKSFPLARKGVSA